VRSLAALAYNFPTVEASASVRQPFSVLRTLD